MEANNFICLFMAFVLIGTCWFGSAIVSLVGDGVNVQQMDIDWNGIIAIGTWGLVIYTARLANLAHEQANNILEIGNRQLRAYITIGEGQVNYNKEKMIYNISFLILNHGQTPAHNVRISEVVEVVDWPLAVNHIKLCGSEPIGYMTPGSRINHREDPFTVNDEQRASLLDNTKVILVKGLLTYKDAFENERYLEFERYVGGVEQVMLFLSPNHDIAN